jgi:hypothetical protein
MQLQLGMSARNCATRLVLRAELQRNDVAQEGHKLVGGMAGSGLTQDPSVFGVERDVERERAMPMALEVVALGPPSAKRRHRVQAIEGLNRGLLIDTEHHGVMRRIDIEPDHIGGLAHDVWSSEAM